MESGKATIHCCIDRSVHDALTEHCERTGQTKTMAIKRAILAYCRVNGVADEAAANAILEARGGLP